MIFYPLSKIRTEVRKVNQSQKMYFDKECPFYVETCFLLIFENVNVFYYNDNGLDGTRGRHSIWRRWGRYQEDGLDKTAFLFVKTIFLYAVERFLQKSKMLIDQRC